uniref:ATP-dependent DNA ligase family profile domain-containing protein n=1 Tax=viral metagenome TaxID=1070528 RepID=A0A6C0HYX5_9ZZZZ
MNIFTMKTLYNTTVGTGRKKQWSICVLENGPKSYTIKTSHGIVGGKMINHETIITEGKNIGKKNETSPKQQAILEAEREWTKKNRQGYNCSENTESNTNTEIKNDNVLTGIKPMLATEFVQSSSLSYPVYIQPKLDGVRCLVYIGPDGKLIFQSRQNTIFETVKHLQCDLSIIFDKISEFGNAQKFILDGELYIHGRPFNEITSMVRKSNHIDASQLQYHIYDCLFLDKLDLKFNERNIILHELSKSNKSPNIVFVETETANSLDDIEHFHTHYTTLQNPYEGIMIRKINSQYKQQNRSKDLQKYKKFFDEEFEIVDFNEGTGSHSGTPIFVCRSNINPDKTFKATMQGTIESRRKIMENIEEYIGKMLTVKYQEKSVEDGIPRFPVGIEVRDYE